MKTKGKAKKPRLGRVEISFGYTVDLDDKDMVDEAKECAVEDVLNAVKYNEEAQHIKVLHLLGGKEEDIPEFLLDSRRMRQESST